MLTSNRFETPAGQIGSFRAQIQLASRLFSKIASSAQLADQNEEPGNQKTHG